MQELETYARKYNSPDYFKTDPIIFPKHFATLMEKGEASLQDVEIAAVILEELTVCANTDSCCAVFHYHLLDKRIIVNV